MPLAEDMEVPTTTSIRIMAIYASSHARGTQRVDVVSLGAISAPLLSLAPGQVFVAQADRPKAGPAGPKAVHAVGRGTGR
jgi:hypothetical protein